MSAISSMGNASSSYSASTTHPQGANFFNSLQPLFEQAVNPLSLADTSAQVVSLSNPSSLKEKELFSFALRKCPTAKKYGLPQKPPSELDEELVNFSFYPLEDRLTRPNNQLPFRNKKIKPMSAALSSIAVDFLGENFSPARSSSPSSKNRYKKFAANLELMKLRQTKLLQELEKIEKSITSANSHRYLLTLFSVNAIHEKNRLMTEVMDLESHIQKTWLLLSILSISPDFFNPIVRSPSTAVDSSVASIGYKKWEPPDGLASGR